MWGHQSNPLYSQSPERFQSDVLEQRVFKTPNTIAGRKKRRTKSAHNSRSMKKIGGRLSMEQGVAKYSNPGERPQHKKAQRVNHQLIQTKLSSSNPAMVKALNPGGKQSEFMKNLNKPMIKSQI